jgi:hypothetical protein
MKRGDGHILPFSQHFQGWIAARELAKNLSAEMPEDVQNFATESGNPELHGLHIVNFTNSIDCIDFRSSQIAVWPDDPRRVRAAKRLVLKGDRLSSCLIFRPKGALGYVIVSGVGKKMMEAAGVKCDFFDPNFAFVKNRKFN